MGRGNPSNRNNLATVINSVENRLAQNTVVLGSKFRISRRSETNVK